MAFMPVKLTMRPQPFSSMPGKQARDSHTEASRSTEMMRRHSASLISRNGLLGRSAALFTRTSTAPNCLIAVSAIFLQSSGLPTSPMTTSVLAPSFSASLATLSQAARSLEPLRTTSKPSSARPSTQARPMLRPAPVINATLRVMAGNARLQSRSCGVAARQDAPLEWRAPSKDAPLAWCARCRAPSGPSDHAAGLERVDRLAVVAQARQHLVGMLAELRRGPELLGLRRVGEVDRLADHLDVAELGMLHRPGDAEIFHLRLGEGLVDGVDRPARHARLVQRFHPVRRRVGPGDGGDALVHRLAVLRAQAGRGVLGMVQKLGRAQRLGAALPQILA